MSLVGSFEIEKCNANKKLLKILPYIIPGTHLIIFGKILIKSFLR